MRALLKTNDPVLLSFAEALLADADVGVVIFDENASVMDGSLGILPRRLMVADEDFSRARRLLDEALAHKQAPRQETADRFLGGRVTVRQFEGGFRSGLDAVMLAAAVPARAGDEVLELGSGAGAASLCLAARVPGTSIVGAEVESNLVALANRNATANGFGERAVFVTVDVLDLPPDMRREYDHVFTNPPYHGAEGHLPPDVKRAAAMHDRGALAEWLSAGVKRTRSGGTFTSVVRADRLGEALAALPAVGLTLFPLFPHAGEPAKRAIVQLAKGSRAPLSLLPGLVLHETDGRYTAEADAILRGGESLRL